MSRVAEIQVVQPLVSRPPRFRAAYVGAIETALAFARPLAEGRITYGEVEARLLPFLAGPDWERAHDARREAAGIIANALAVWEATHAV